jgi:hypothetical protein
VAAQFGAAALGGDFSDGTTLDMDDVPEPEREGAFASLQVLASIEQGHRLRDDARKLGFQLNPQFEGKLIMASKKKRKLSAGVEMVVAGPMKPELKKLQDKHDAWLKAQEKKKRPAGASLAAYVDRSVPNLSSIVTLVTAGEANDRKTMLLTGDARGDKVLQAWSWSAS